MTTALSAEARRDGVSLDAADGLWLQAGFPLRAAFLASMQRWFGSDLSSVDFAHHLAAALASINEWVSAHTDGKITQLFSPGQVTSMTRLVLASAVYFDAAWQEPFDPTRTVTGSFTVPAGAGTSTVAVHLMTGTVTGAAATPAYDVARLAYRGGDDEAIVAMPLHESLPAFLGGLDTTRLDSIAAAASSPALVALPRFTTTSALDLVPTLSAMGMPAAFSSGADLSALSPEPTQVQSVVQRDFLEVNEAGTQAAAATGISVEPTAVAPVSPPIVFDHPFLFVIENVTTGALLFTSAVEDPATGAAAAS
jgi:serpin B